MSTHRKTWSKSEKLAVIDMPSTEGFAKTSRHFNDFQNSLYKSKQQLAILWRFCILLTPRHLGIGARINQLQLNNIQMTLDEFREIHRQISEETGLTTRIVLPGEEEPTNKTIITFVKDSSKRRDLNPNFGKEPDKMTEEPRRKAGRLTEAERVARREETIEHVI